MTTASSTFEPECRAALDGVRAALLELYSSVGADPEGPQEVSRRFKVNKTLAWNVSRVMTTSDPLSSIANLPGSSAFQTLLSAIERGGADPVALKRARAAVNTLDETVTRHVGDRATLELIVDGISPDRDDHLGVSRKLAFRGNSGLLGVQARTRLMTVFMAPNQDDADRIDIAVVRGYIGLRRLRSEVRWPIFQLRGWGHDQDLGRDDRWVPLEDPEGGERAMPLMRRFSTVNAKDIEAQHTATGTNYVLAPGPVGNIGAVDCFVGDAGRSVASKYRTEKDTTGEFGATISAPTERLIFDLLFDERLDFALQPEVRAFMGIFMDPSEEAVPEGRLPLPIPQTTSILPGRPPAVATASAPRYPELVQYVGERMNWKLDTFRGCRLDLSHPPLGSTILLRFKLPAAPK